MINKADTAWILVATTLVLFMTLPGLALFYAGLVRRKNIISVLFQCLMIACIVSITWLAYGYSLAFGDLNPFIGGLHKAFLNSVQTNSLSNGIPEYLFFAFQMTFAIITPALIIGAVVERMKLSALLLFIAAWSLLVYAPVCHWVWGPGGFLAARGVKDLAGGIVVHLTAGVAALVTCIEIGERRGPQSKLPLKPHNLPMCFTGAGMLWVGWFGFNAGSGPAADVNAAQTLVVTHLSAVTATIIWVLADYFEPYFSHSPFYPGKPSLLGAVTGSIAGLAAITPASGDVGPLGALAIGCTAGIVCWIASNRVKAYFDYDDTLDVVGVHGIGGLVGIIGVAVFASETLGGKGIVSIPGSTSYSIVDQLLVQVVASSLVIAYTTTVTFVILQITKIACEGLRVTAIEEVDGLDQSTHGETA